MWWKRSLKISMGLTHALISMLLSWTKHTDRKGSTVRVVLFDDNRAFDLIYQVIPATKLTSLVITSSIGGTGYSSFLGGNLIKVGGNKLTSLMS